MWLPKGGCTLIAEKRGVLGEGNMVGSLEAGITGTDLSKFPPGSSDADLEGIDCMIKDRPDPNNCKYIQFLKPSQQQNSKTLENGNCGIETRTDSATIVYPAVRYVKMDVSVLVSPNEPAVIKEPFVKEVDDYCTKLNGKAPAGLKNLKQAS